MSIMRRWGNAVLGLFGLQIKAGIGHPEELRQLLLRGQTSLSGAQVNDETAMRVSAVNAAVRILAETVASLPLIVFRKLERGGKERAEDDPRFKLLHDRPNAWQTSFEWREQVMAHLALRGNSYSLKSVVRGRVAELVPLHPDQVEVRQRSTGELEYKVHPRLSRFSQLQREVRTYQQEQILHIRGISSDGVVGRSVLSDARDSMGLAMTEQRHAAILMGQGAKPAGVLTHPATLGPEVAERMQRSWEETYGGPDNAGKTVVLEEGVTWTPTTMTSADAQFLESRRFSIADVARFFRVPLHMLQELQRSTNNNIEQQSRDFVMHTIRPWLVRIEQALKRDIFEGEDDVFVEHLVEGMLRADMKTRFDGWESAIMTGWMNVNEVREKENLNPVGSEGSAFLQPLNMEERGGERRQRREEPARQPEDDEEEDDDE